MSTAEQEDAATLNLGEEFQDAEQTLCTSELYFLLSKINGDREGKGEAVNKTLTDTLQYATDFNRFSSVAQTENIRNILSNHDLEPFEISSIMNLLPESADEAKELVPSLKRMEDMTIEDMLEEMHEFMNE
eukprot:TRINITY_DN5846_c0_g2_i4.p1 TRINITY_DN5846_c0_g2~~TRINITY_DN5846_c0_g2_i4.p1  ORF type:complete len:139 (-),score=35.23 TRINITY_DN5846_c0_g2_i4:426-818(-)